MAGIVGIFAAIGDHIPILKKEKLGQPEPEGKIHAFHYRGTCLLIMSFCLLVTTTEWISGTGSIIECLRPASSSIPENVINTYCYIMGTFSVPKLYKDYDTVVGNQIAETGVGPFVQGEDTVSVKAYYQWVPFMLFLQGIMFYLPHIVYKIAEGGKIRLIIAGLNQWIMSDEDRHSKHEELASYLIETRGTHIEWCLHILGASALYLVNVVGQIFFTDCFLGYEFSTYGVHAASFLDSKPEDRIDPMSRVFPRVTKCTFRKYGPSGTLQLHDAQCVLPINIINEKIYVFLWFWFCILSVLTILNFLFDVAIVFNSSARRIIIARKLKLSPNKNKLKIDVNLIAHNLDFGDWKLMYHLLRNMDALVFGEFCEHFTELLHKEHDRANGGDETLKLKNLLNDEYDGPTNPNRSSAVSSLNEFKAEKQEEPNEEEFLNLTDGNYLQSAKGSKESQI